ncbi:MAG: recombinase RecA [Thermoplasmata archaeon]|nr:recombinase RecA [Thermoplasmata archaeon]
MSGTTSIGIQELDKALMDGIPKGYTILVTGTPGTGVELFAKQFAAAGIGTENVTYFSTTERDEDVKNAMKEFGWEQDIRVVNIGKMYYEKVLAKNLEISRYRQEGLKMKDILQYKAIPADQAYDINFLTTLTYGISKLKPPFRIVLDSLDFFLEYYEESDVLSAMRTIKAHTQHNEGIALATMLKGVFSNRIESGVEDIVDITIELERLRDGSKYKRNLLIRKVRNHPEKTKILSCTIDKKGISAKSM